VGGSSFRKFLLLFIFPEDFLPVWYSPYRRTSVI